MQFEEQEQPQSGKAKDKKLGRVEVEVVVYSC